MHARAVHLHTCNTHSGDAAAVRVNIYPRELYFLTFGPEIRHARRLFMKRLEIPEEKDRILHTPRVVHPSATHFHEIYIDSYYRLFTVLFAGLLCREDFQLRREWLLRS